MAVTLREMMTGALVQLDRGADAQTMEQWRDKLTRFLNDALVDLAFELQLRRTDPLQLTGGTADTAELPRQCVKVLSLRRDGVRYPFYYGAGTSKLHVPGLGDGPVEITYRYLPAVLDADTDAPEIPAQWHSAMVTYAVGRERAAGDAASIQAAKVCFELYQAVKRSMRTHLGEAEAYRIVNAY